MATEVQQRAINGSIVTATLGKWYTALPMVCVLGATAAFYVKCVLFDTVLGLGSTPKLGGDIEAAFNLVMGFWFGAAGVRGTVAAVRGLWR